MTNQAYDAQQALKQETYKPQIYSERKRLLVDYEIARSFVERVALPGKQSSTYSCHDYIIVSPK